MKNIIFAILMLPFAAGADMGQCLQDIYDNDPSETQANSCFEGITEIEVEEAFDGLIDYGIKKCPEATRAEKDAYIQAIIDMKKGCPTATSEEE